MSRRWSRYVEYTGAEETGRYVDMFGHTVLYFRAWTGAGDGDPAAQIDKWVAMYKGDEVPEFSRLWPEEVRYSFDGLEGDPMFCQHLENEQEQDDEAAKAESEHRELIRNKESDRYGRHRETALDYERFWQAVEAYTQDPSDNNAWRMIQKWRSRQLREEDRELFINS